MLTNQYERINIYIIINMLAMKTLTIYITTLYEGEIRWLLLIGVEQYLV